MLIGPVLSAPGSAQELTRVRGTLAEVALPRLVVDSDERGRVETTLTDDTGIYVVTPGSRDDIEQGQFVGITSIGTASDRRVALEVHIFAEELRGLGEGHYPWDLTSEPTMMTNAEVVTIDAIEDGPMLTVSYTEENDSGGTSDALQEGEQQIMIPEEIPIVHFAKSDQSMLAPGKQVFLLMSEEEAGAPVLLGIVVGDGVEPPM
jgi:hypothetical protein